MKRVMIVGGPGSGKSTLARWMGAQTGLPVQHMDQIHWRPDWVERSMAEKVALIGVVEACDRWIIEGAVAPRYRARLARPDLAEGCTEQFSMQTPKLLVWVWRRHKLQRQKIIDAIDSQEGTAVVLRLTGRRAVARFT